MEMAQESHNSLLLLALEASLLFRVSLSCLVSLLIWRLWKFTISPRLYPDEPRTYPYWIPFIGHSITFFRDAEDTMHRARVYFGNSREPFKLIIMGEIVYVITSNQDTNLIYKSESFSQDPWLVDLMRQFGASPSSVKAMWSRVPGAEKGKSPIDPEIGLQNWEQKPVKEVCVMLFRTLLNPGRYSDAMLDVLLSTVHERMTWNGIQDWMVLERQNDMYDVSLLTWSKHVLLEGATRSFFGNALLELEPNLFDHFCEFDDSSWKLPYNIPDIFAQDVKRAKATAEQALVKYFSLPRERRADASKLMQEVEAVLIEGGIEPKDMGSLVLMFYWVINANAWKASFWMLAEIVNNNALRTTILREIEPFVSPLSQATLSSSDLATELQRCPTLVAVYHESLRMTASSTSVRTVMEDTRIRRFRYQKKARMVIPYRQMMLDEATYGDEVHEFRYERFLQNPNLHKSPNYRPFGGGSTLCPGKALAQKEILTFVALALGKFQVQLSRPTGKTCVPEMNTRTPCIGIMAPTGAGDVRVSISKPQW